MNPAIVFALTMPFTRIDYQAFDRPWIDPNYKPVSERKRLAPAVKFNRRAKAKAARKANRIRRR